MRTIDEVRVDIEKIDKEIKDLFLKRMSYSKEMGEIKRNNNLPILDLKREEYLKELYSKDIKEFKDEYLKFIENVFSLSKETMKK